VACTGPVVTVGEVAVVGEALAAVALEEVVDDALVALLVCLLELPHPAAISGIRAAATAVAIRLVIIGWMLLILAKRDNTPGRCCPFLLGTGWPRNPL
jgi:hypothetical protein